MHQLRFLADEKFQDESSSNDNGLDFFKIENKRDVLNSNERACNILGNSLQ